MVSTKDGSATTLRLQRTFKARREDVFRAWTDPKALTAWWSPEGWATPVIEVDLRAGGRYRFRMKRLTDGPLITVEGTYREVKPPEKLVYTWNGDFDPDMKETVVTVEFRDAGESTEVVLTHERFPTEKLRGEHREGWTGCFDRIAAYLSGR